MTGGHSDKACQDTRVSLRELYTRLAEEPDADFGWARGKENAHALGYAKEWLEHLPDTVWESAAAVGNPFSLGPLHAGETIIDVGCGAGADACVAAMLVGAEGSVHGIDCTPAMVEKARRNAAISGLTNVTIHAAEMTALPLPDACADVVISNGAINLAQDKAAVIDEIFRVLRPNGRLQIADMVRTSPVDSAACNSSNEESWANCVTGTLEPDTFLSLLTAAGFIDAALAGYTGYKTAAGTIGALIKARKPA